MVTIKREHWQALVDHARSEAPNECCGYMRLADGRVEEVFPAENIRRSPYGYELGFKDLMAANELEDQGFGVAIYHSHPRSPAEPSQTDINLANYPNWLQVIVSLADPERPVVRAFWIDGGEVREEPLAIDDG
ncbi:M67 family metallopeptidase [Thermoleophilum album]|jgi:proteasome lid subunit RPN8/RPN11|uniref:M67 family metallopeptidase n=1 Tax=Thermoleophilum album TaxID=29539 RepID=UPI00237C70C1|nr:M67 family metallopeptidase [Thermoleophilum album]WDT93180.1 M67 family metallopeptidase [Thermoleophilum album]